PGCWSCAVPIPAWCPAAAAWRWNPGAGSAAAPGWCRTPAGPRPAESQCRLAGFGAGCGFVAAGCGCCAGCSSGRTRPFRGSPFPAASRG
nr:hypothetical protein [Tanacetum cinerariifolium]